MTTMTTEEIVSMLNEAVAISGMQGITIDTDDYTTALESIADMPKDQINALINNMYLIAEQRGFTNLMSAKNNPFREFIHDANEYGWTIQDYMLQILDGFTPYWDSSYGDDDVAEGLVKDYEQKVSTEYHYTPFEKQFGATINEKDYKKYFYAKSFGDFVNGKIANLNSSGEIYLEKDVLIDEIKDMCVTDAGESDAVHMKGYDPNSDIGIKHIIEDLKTVYTGFTQPNDDYNADGIVSITPDKSMIYLVTKASFLNRLKVYVNSGIFNLDEISLPENILIVPESESLGVDSDNDPIHCVLLDRRAICVALRTWRMTEFFIPNKLRHNHWLSVEGIRGHNTFCNCVAFSGDAISTFPEPGGTGVKLYKHTFTSTATLSSGIPFGKVTLITNFEDKVDVGSGLAGFLEKGEIISGSVVSGSGTAPVNCTFGNISLGTTDYPLIPANSLSGYLPVNIMNATVTDADNYTVEEIVNL